MGSDNLILVCPQCRTKNRVPKHRLAENPLCGRCKRILFVEGIYTSRPRGGKRDIFFDYRGNIQALAAQGSDLIFVTRHEEAHPTGVYRVHLPENNLSLQPLPCGATALAVSPISLFAGGDNGSIYNCSDGVNAVALDHSFDDVPLAMALLKEDQLAVLLAHEIGIMAIEEGRLLQTIKLDENEQGNCLAAESSGRFIVAGTSKGRVLVFEREASSLFQLSEAGHLHKGQVTALIFEKDETRFLSAGSDAKLLSTHVRGKLEPEDRSKGAMHTKAVSAMAMGPHRFYTGAADKTIKAWPPSGRPATYKEQLGQVTALTPLALDGRTYLAAALSDNTLRCFSLDDAGKPVEMRTKFHDVYALAKYELGRSDPAQRQAVLEMLAGLCDRRSLEIIAGQVTSDKDAGVRRAAVALIADARHESTAGFLEKFIGHSDEAVRLAAFQGLIGKLTDTPLKPVDLALAAGKADVGSAAILLLEKSAAGDDQAMARLEQALDHELGEIRKAALSALETNCPADSPQADLKALESSHWDIRRLALIRLFQRKMLANGAVQAALRNAMEDAQTEVRLTAFHLSLTASPNLLSRLRSQDPELHRQLYEIESFGRPPDGEIPPPPEEKVSLAAEDLDPLLKAMACRAMDVCLAGTCAMAQLGDSRAFGLLMQLSRDESGAVRSDVCRAFAHLKDQRGIRRLRSLIHDSAADVRDAAFSALALLYDARPLAAVEAGLNTAFEEIKRRALKILIGVISNVSRPISGQTQHLLEKALNDDAPSVRSEAFKSSLNLEVQGGEKETLRFIAGCIHADVRRNVLLEVVARRRKAWAEAALTDFFNDSDSGIRKEAFEYAVEQPKRVDPGIMSRGMASTYPDMRLKTVDELSRNVSEATRALLVEAIRDGEKEIRQRALDVLLKRDAAAVLPHAFASPYGDIRLRSAEVAANLGDRNALNPMLDALAAEEPDGAEKKILWAADILSALRGIGRLGVPEAIPAVEKYLLHKKDDIRLAAIEALVRISRPGQTEALSAALAHSDGRVGLKAALGLAYCGNALGERLLFSQKGSQTVSHKELLTAAFMLDIAGEKGSDGGFESTAAPAFDRLLGYLDHSDAQVQKIAFLLLMLMEPGNGEGEPQGCIAALAARHARIRLQAARALTAVGEDFIGYLTHVVNDRDDGDPWSISSDVIQRIRSVLYRAPLHVRSACVRRLFYLNSHKQAQWDQAWESFLHRHGSQIPSIDSRASISSPEMDAMERLDLLKLAFGTYVGLIRDQRGRAAYDSRLNRSALRRMYVLAETNDILAEAVRPVLIQTLSHPHKEVRLPAFEYLESLGISPQSLGEAALQSGHKDLGVLGLKLLSRSAVGTSGASFLEHVMRMRKDGLEIDAAKLLAEEIGRIAVSEMALEASSPALRRLAMKWLIAGIDTDQQALDLLRRAVQNRYAAVRLEAGVALGQRKDAAAFDALLALLRSPGHREDRGKLIQALEDLGDDRTPHELLDYMETDSVDEVDWHRLVGAVGRFRRADTFERLLMLFLKSEKWDKSSVFQALLRVSGFDQDLSGLAIEFHYNGEDNVEIFQFKRVVATVKDPDDEISFEEARGLDPECQLGDSLGVEISEESYRQMLRQNALTQKFPRTPHPRRTDLLTRLLSACIDLDKTGLIRRLLDGVKVARDDQVDPYLGLLTEHGEEKLRHTAVAVVGFRLQNRNGPADALIKALSHKDPITKFLAAEALSLAQRSEGLQVLLTAVDLMAELGYRRRAVRALGKLAHRRSLNTLLRLADEDGHALQEEAIEAIGHMGETEQAEKIFGLLQQVAAGNDGRSQMALKGLRWFNTRNGWRLIREKARDGSYRYRKTAIELLAYNDDPATVDLLLSLIKNGDQVMSAYQSAQKILGKLSLEPDYALLQSPYTYGRADALNRVSEKGEAARILGVLQHCDSSIQADLVTILLRRDPLPLDAAVVALDSTFEPAIDAAAQIIGRTEAVSGKICGQLTAVLIQTMERWRTRRRDMAERGNGDRRLLDSLTRCVRRLIWAAGQIGAAKEVLIATAAAHLQDSFFTPLREAAIQALERFEPDAEIAAVLETAVSQDHPALRMEAAAILGKFDSALVGPMDAKRVGDRQGAVFLDAHLKEATVVESMESLHYQSIVAPLLVADQKVDALKAVAMNGSLAELERLGAIEALGKTATRSAEAVLIAIGENDLEDQDLRKSAWRALKRSKRAQERAAAV